ncbi:fimbrial protein [Enterobacter sp. A11]|uniref:fimbrial protein n=1 Tax=unclassified Enterobacter TaxID=2608935 RepID=UPI00106FB31A|nr:MULTISPECIES: fimbrial protein [unclassified Enterobacter]MBM1022724.1 fimbrial protein [Enterobacter sp. E1]MEA3563866.1 fimbrial protein [Enterobacter sp. GM-22]MEA3597445.1 fimbrial protein [Enterobacter sp. GM-31]TFF56515.1 fimbrial protein [Enterobacter sp. A11]
MKFTLNHFVRCIYAATLLSVTSGYAQAADNLDVTFTANIRETTCDMAISGGTGNGKNNTITLGTNAKTRIDTIAAGTATTDFKLVLTECPSSLSSLKTTVSGSASTVKTAIANGITAASGGASYVGVSIARSSLPTAPFEINSTDDSKRIVWSPGEISAQEVPLTAKLVETQAGSATTGQFNAVATFNFYYE